MAQGKIRRKDFIYGAGAALAALSSFKLFQRPKAGKAEVQAETARLSERIVKESRSVPYGESV